ncbi:MAG: hypothetical protein WCL18_09950 [bacterium]
MTVQQNTNNEIQTPTINTLVAIASKKLAENKEISILDESNDQLP